MRHVSFETPQKYLYLTLLVLLPTQFGKHFWPFWSYVSGIRIDYLSPTLYVTDIFILLLFFLIITQKMQHPLKLPLTASFTKKKTLVILFCIIVLIGIYFSKVPYAGIYGALKIAEFVFFAWYSAQVLGKMISFRAIGIAVSLAVLFESLLSLAQYIFQGSLGGIFYFFGERAYTTNTPGIANASIFGQLVLRPYGTLPHPNVLAGFLLIGTLFFLGCWHYYGKREKIYVTSVSVFAVIALLLTLSRITILWAACVGALFLIKKLSALQPRIIYYGSSILCVLFAALFLTTPLLGRFLSTSLSEEAVTLREGLALHALWMIYTHSIWGVGINNFLQNLPASMGKATLYTQLQPVHNIYLLAFSQVGILGGSFLVWGLYKTYKWVTFTHVSFLRYCVSLMFWSFLFLGLFDHYFLTLQQGQLLVALLIGIMWSLPKTHAVAVSKKEKGVY